MKNSIHFAIGGIVAIIIAIIVMVGINFYIQQEDIQTEQPPNPREFLRIEQLTQTVVAGKDYTYRLAATNRRSDCKGDRRIRHILNISTGENREIDNEVRPDPIFNTAVVSTLKVPIPADLQTGFYRIHVYRSYSCPEGIRSIEYWTPNFNVIAVRR